MLIAFEGGEGVGKTTQVDMLYEALESLRHQYKKVVMSIKPPRMIRYQVPGHTGLGGEIRGLLQSKELPKGTERHLFCLDMWLTQRNFSSDFLHVADRWYFSTLVYQADTCVEEREVLGLVRDYGIKVPDLVIYLSGDPETCLRRAVKASEGAGEPSKYEMRDIQYHKKIHERYRIIMGRYSGRKCMPNPNMSEEDQHKCILQTVLQMWGSQ